MSKTTIQVSDTVRVREGGLCGEWVVWVLSNDKYSQYGVYGSREGALDVAAWLAQRAA
jgi:hypothetical protein